MLLKKAKPDNRTVPVSDMLKLQMNYLSLIIP